MNIVKKKKRIIGFTLLELLVVIGIISVLVSLGTFSYSTAQKKARDTKRKSDLQAIKNGLEQYYSICGFNYPTPGGSVFSSVICLSPSTVILPTVPVDPKTITPYPCASCDSSTYNVCATLEAETPASYCVNNQQ